jgi:Mg-chelatase subunit ChlD
MQKLAVFRWSALLSLVTGVGALIACGSSGDSSFGTAGDAGQRGDSTLSRDGAGGDGSGRSPDGSVLHGNGDAGPGDDGKVMAADAACATNNVAASLIPAYLVFVMDRSDSMKQYGKWPACSAALETFFADPSTVGISSSLTFMPFVPDGSVDNAADPTYSCVASAYVTPSVPMTALPSSAFTPVIAAETLKLGTPTRPALEGALQYARTIKAAHPTDKVLIVLATDGYPAGCTDDTIPYVADAASVANTEDGIPVYVIGPDTASNTGIGNLNKVAEAGGTGSAFFLPTETDGGDAAVTTAAFLAAVRSIQSKLTCKYAIPSPPAGQKLDLDKVNVVLTIADAGTTLSYSASCADPTGWTFDEDDAGNPDDIVLCSGACQEAKEAGARGSASVAFGCATVGGTPK